MKTKYFQTHKNKLGVKNGSTNMTRQNRYAFIYLFIFCALIVNVFLSINIAGIGGKVVGVESKIQDVAKVNHEYSQALISFSSLTSLAENTEGLGLVSPEKIVYFDNLTNIAGIIK